MSFKKIFRTLDHLHVFFLVALLISVFSVYIFVPTIELIGVSKLIVLFLLIGFYVLRSSKLNVVFLVSVLFFATGGILLEIGAKKDIPFAIGSYMISNLLIMVVIAFKIGIIEVKKFLKISIPFIALSFFIVSYFFDAIGIEKIPIFIYANVVALLCSLSLYYYLKTKYKDAIYFFISSLIFATISVFKAIGIFVILDISNELLAYVGYLICIYFLFRAMLIDNYKNILKKESHKLI